MIGNPKISIGSTICTVDGLESFKVSKILYDRYNGFWISYNTLTKEFDFSNEAYCRVCFQYLEQLGYVYVIDNGDDGELFVTLKAKGIDFLESD